MSNRPYDNIVLENKFESLLKTKVDMSNYLTADYSLSENPGMKKVIHTYKATGSVEDLTQGQGNSGIFEASFEAAEYTVGVTQGKGVYYDEEEMKDPQIPETILKGMSEDMINDFTEKAIAEMGKGNRAIECDFTTSTAGYFFEKVVDALAILGEDTANYTLLISPKNQAYVRKQLRDDLKYAEGFVRTGYIGSVSGVPVVMSAAVPDTACYIVNREAVTLFVKKGTEVESERDADHRKNTRYIRKVALVALTNAKKLVAIAKAQTTACAITSYTKAQKTVSGTCGTDCFKVAVDVDGKAYVATPSSGSWSITADENLAAGDNINAVAYQIGMAPKAATEVTVAS